MFIQQTKNEKHFSSSSGLDLGSLDFHRKTAHELPQPANGLPGVWFSPQLVHSEESPRGEDAQGGLRITQQISQI